MYKLKEQIDLTLNGNATDKVEIRNGTLTIHEQDTIELKQDGWYINGTYQGKGAEYEYVVEEPIKKELFDEVFEEE